MKSNNSKVVIVGAGNVGSTTAYTLINQCVCNEIILIDMNMDKAAAEAQDMQHSVYFMNRNTNIRCGQYSDCKDADVVIITAAAPMDINADNRFDMLAPSKKVMKSVITQITESGFDGIILVISNPVDIMTYYAWKLSGLPSNRVIGSGTNLDMARLCCEISSFFNIDPKGISCYVIGEHGDSEVVCWNNATIGNKSLSRIMKDNSDRSGGISYEQMRKDTTQAGWNIFHKKGNTSYGIAASAASIVKSILFDDRKIVPVCCRFDGQYGLRDVYLSSPAVLSRNGVQEIVEIDLTDDELADLHKTSEIVRSFYEALRD